MLIVRSLPTIDPGQVDVVPQFCPSNSAPSSCVAGFIDFIVDPSFQVMGDMLEKIILPLHQRNTIAEECFSPDKTDKATSTTSLGSRSGTPGTPRSPVSPGSCVRYRCWVEPGHTARPALTLRSGHPQCSHVPRTECPRVNVKGVRESESLSGCGLQEALLFGSNTSSLDAAPKSFPAVVARCSEQVRTVNEDEGKILCVVSANPSRN